MRTEPGTGPVPVARAARPSEELDDHDYVDLPGESRLPRWLAVLLVLVVVAGVVFGGARWWYGTKADPPGPPGDVVTVVVPEGASTTKIGDLLADEGVVSSSFLFNFHVSRASAGPWKSGSYAMREGSSFDEAIEDLDRGPGAAAPGAEGVSVTLPEGRTLEQILAKIAEVEPRLTVADLRAALDGGDVASSLRPSDQPSYEGLLFPATYEVGDDTDAAELLGELSAEMDGRVEALDPAAARASLAERFGLELSTYDLVKVASIVQAEAGSPEEMAKVATVVYNRLVNADGSFPYLGIDAIDRYGAERAGMELAQYWETTEPYNSRGVAGLPPTPIGAPGDAALAAAMNPADGDWLWYVLSDPGVHAFVRTQAEFDQAKAICQDKGLC